MNEDSPILIGETTLSFALNDIEKSIVLSFIDIQGCHNVILGGESFD